MTTLVLGAGVIGVTTAYYLARAGRPVMVVDRQPGPALETSFANGGQISACHTEPWATPATLPKVLKWLGRDDAPLKFRLKADPALWSWCLRFLVNCTPGRADANTERMLRVALYSRDRLDELIGETGITYDQLSKGIVHVYEDERELATAAMRAALMNRLGLERRVLDAAACAALEPALKAAVDRGMLCGGIHTPDDESGDAHAFTTALAERAREMGARFRYDTPIERLVVDGGRFAGVETPGGFIAAEAGVLALGSYSPLLLRPLGVRLPVYPAKGYSVTLPLQSPSSAPSVSLIQDERKLVYSRLGQRLRVAGTAEIAGYDTEMDDRRAGFILDAALQLFPGCGDPEEAEFWTGLRPKTPDSVPVLGPSGIPGLFLNTGHGTLGWTMACGSGKITADLIAGGQSAIDLDGLTIRRFQ